MDYFLRCGVFLRVCFSGLMGVGGQWAVLLQAAPLPGALSPQKALKNGLFAALGAGLFMQQNRPQDP
jgi:hypothetical protein